MAAGGDDPFGRLGLPGDASLDDVRAARRRLAKEHHPDHGGDPATMQAVNAAFDAAVRTLLHRPPSTAPTEAPTRPAPATTGATRPRRALGPPTRAPGVRLEHDTPSFTIDRLPAEAFEALLIVTAWHGDVLVDDPPYVLEVHLHDPAPCWCPPAAP